MGEIACRRHQVFGRSGDPSEAGSSPTPLELQQREPSEGRAPEKQHRFNDRKSAERLATPDCAKCEQARAHQRERVRLGYLSEAVSEGGAEVEAERAGAGG